MQRRCSECGLSKDLRKFPVHKTSRLGRRKVCRECWNKKRRKGKKLRGPGSRTLAGFRVRSDPMGLYRLGHFNRLDFVCSLAGGDVWAEGMIVLDEKGKQYCVVYDPEPALVRSDGKVFRPDPRGMALVPA